MNCCPRPEDDVVALAAPLPSSFWTRTAKSFGFLFLQNLTCFFLSLTGDVKDVLITWTPNPPKTLPLQPKATFGCPRDIKGKHTA